MTATTAEGAAGRLDGRVAVVTGASSGLGAATVRRLAAGGARVWAAARSQDLLADLAAALDGFSAPRA